METSTFKKLTQIEHTLFGLPFILSGVILGFANSDFVYTHGDWIRWVWVLPAFLMARLSGMSFNQLIDRYIDAKNPRTSDRVLPSGKASPLQAGVIAWGSLLLFLLFCLQINLFCAILSLLAALLIFIYSYMKRITASCHYILGLIHFLAPVMASGSIIGKWDLSSTFLGTAAFFLIGGSDIIWGLQDYDYDLEHHIKSIPVLVGPQKSILYSRISHLFSTILLIAAGISSHLSAIYYLAPVIVFSFFLYSHAKIGKRFEQEKTHLRIHREFLFMNFSVSLTVFIFILGAALWGA